MCRTPSFYWARSGGISLASLQKCITLFTFKIRCDLLSFHRKTVRLWRLIHNNTLCIYNDMLVDIRQCQYYLFCGNHFIIDGDGRYSFPQISVIENIICNRRHVKQSFTLDVIYCRKVRLPLLIFIILRLSYFSLMDKISLPVSYGKWSGNKKLRGASFMVII